MSRTSVGEFLTGACVALMGLLVLFVLINLALGSTQGDDAQRVLADHPVFDARNRAVLERLYGLPIDDVRTITSECWPADGWIYEPYVQFRERPRSGRFVNISDEGFRHNRAKASRTLADTQGVTAVFLFGGSTSFGYGVRDQDTIAAHLERILRERWGDDRIMVYNFGRGYYGSKQERLLFESLLHRRSVPRLAIFLDGVNEHFAFCPAFANNVAEMFRIAQEDPGAKLRSVLGALPIVRALRPPRLSALAANNLYSIRSVGGQAFECEPRRDRDFVSQLTESYRRNRGMVRQLARNDGVEVRFFIQPVPGYRNLLHTTPYGQAVPERGPILDHLAATLVDEDTFDLTGALEDFAGDGFVDNVHYTGPAAAHIAVDIADILADLAPASESAPRR